MNTIYHITWHNTQYMCSPSLVIRPLKALILMSALPGNILLKSPLFVHPGLGTASMLE